MTSPHTSNILPVYSTAYKVLVTWSAAISLTFWSTPLIPIALHSTTLSSPSPILLPSQTLTLTILRICEAPSLMPKHHLLREALPSKPIWGHILCHPLPLTLISFSSQHSWLPDCQSICLFPVCLPHWIVHSMKAVTLPCLFLYLHRLTHRSAIIIYQLKEQIEF